MAYCTEMTAEIETEETGKRESRAPWAVVMIRA